MGGLVLGLSLLFNAASTTTPTTDVLSPNLSVGEPKSTPQTIVATGPGAAGVSSSDMGQKGEDTKLSRAEHELKSSLEQSSLERDPLSSTQSQPPPMVNQPLLEKLLSWTTTTVSRETNSDDKPITSPQNKEPATEQQVLVSVVGEDDQDETSSDSSDASSSAITEEPETFTEKLFSWGKETAGNIQMAVEEKITGSDVDDSEATDSEVKTDASVPPKVTSALSSSSSSLDTSKKEQVKDTSAITSPDKEARGLVKQNSPTSLTKSDDDTLDLKSFTPAERSTGDRKKASTVAQLSSSQSLDREEDRSNLEAMVETEPESSKQTSINIRETR